MEGVLIYAPHDYDATFEERLAARFGQVLQRSPLVVERDGSRVYVINDPTIRNYLETEAELKVLDEMPELASYSVDYSDIRLLRDVLCTIADDPALVVDNDHDVILRGPEFVRLLRARPEWDWGAEAFERWKAAEDAKKSTH
jgi:hypothetical protein